MYRLGLLITLSLGFVFNCPAQNRTFAQKTIDTLASSFFSGRGYINNGDAKAASYISECFSKTGVKPFPNHGFFYSFSFPVVTFPGKCSVKLNGKRLIPGKDFIVDAGCPSIHKKLKINRFKTGEYPEHIKRNTAIVFDTSHIYDRKDIDQSEKYELSVFLQNKLTWSVATKMDKASTIQILKPSWPANISKLSIHVDSKLINHTANNVIGYLEGSLIKDTFIVLTAHYDHLGMMGKTMFPGANDNASGVAMMLDMAHYFSQHPCKYSIAFIAFAGEEPGLIGSKDYTDNPWPELPLGKMKFLVNLDLMGSGEKGLAVVNATVFPQFFNVLKSINTNKNYLSGFKMRGKAANSDHYWFTERGVKSFFFYLMGNYTHYHDINDNRNNLRLGEFYDKSFLLIRDFILII